MYATLKDFFAATLEATKTHPAERKALEAINAIAKQHGLEAGVAAFTNWQQKQALNALPAEKLKQGSLLDTATTKNTDNADDANRLKNWLLGYCNHKKVSRVVRRNVQQYGPIRDKSRFQSALNHLESQGTVWEEKQGRQIFVRVNPDLLESRRPRQATLFLETENDVQNATCPPDKKRVFFHDKEVTGLTLMVERNGTRTYIFEKSVKGDKKRLTLGNAARWTLEDARAQAKKLRVLACQGVDLQTVKSLVKPSVAPVVAPVLPKPDNAPATSNNHQPDTKPLVMHSPEVERAVYKALEACFRQLAEFFQEKNRCH